MRLFFKTLLFLVVATSGEASLANADDGPEVLPPWASALLTTNENDAPSDEPLACYQYELVSDDSTKIGWWTSSLEYDEPLQVRRSYWQQWFRLRISVADVDGVKQAEGYEGWTSSLAPHFRRRLNIIDAEGTKLLQMHGISNNSSSIKHFRITDGHGVHIADARRSEHNERYRQVTFSSAGEPYSYFATLTRPDMQTPTNWHLHLFDVSEIPALAWPILADYLSEGQYTLSAEERRRMIYFVPTKT